MALAQKRTKKSAKSSLITKDSVTLPPNSSYFPLGLLLLTAAVGQMGWMGAIAAELGR